MHCCIALFLFIQFKAAKLPQKIFKVMFYGVNLAWASCPSAGKISLDLIQI